MTTITHETPNGVDVTQLGQTVEAIQNDPSLAIFTFRATNNWLGGGHSRTQVQGFWGAGQEAESRTEPFVLDGDEPPVLLGSNRAPNAVEAVLHALASCLAVGTAYNAAAQGIEIRSLRFDRMEKTAARCLELGTAAEVSAYLESSHPIEVIAA